MTRPSPYYGDSEAGQAGYSAHLRELAEQLREEGDRARRRGGPQLEAAFRDASTTVRSWAEQLLPDREKARERELVARDDDARRAHAPEPIEGQLSIGGEYEATALARFGTTDAGYEQRIADAERAAARS
ncbi:MAG: hypothetical protein ABSG43_08700 [Solirubrobacteraceae bacterium]|jgi:hypothetical protein